MKFFHILIIITIAILIGIVFDAQTALGGGWYPCCIEFKLDKTEYNTGDTVIITVRADQQYENSNENVIVKISDVTFGPDYANVIHQEEKTLEDGKAMFEYKTPQSPDRYRYLLTLESPAGVQSKLFFTKKDASKFVISDIKVLNPVLKQGEPVKFEAKVVDGVGNPAHYARILVTSDMPHETCSTEISGYAGAYLDLSPLYSLQPDYWSSGVVKGDVPITNTVMPGKYDLQVSVGGDIDGYVSSFEYFKIEIIPTDLPEDPPYTVFVPFQYDFGPGFMTEKPINITAKTAYNGCGSIIPNVPIKAEIKRYDLQNAQWMETLQTKEITSDENGVYHVSFEPIGLRAGYYNVLLTSTYQGVEQTIGVGTPNNIKNFTISEEGKDFTVTVDGWYFVPLDVTFDKENKKLTLELDTFDPFKRVDFKIPHELLDGEFRTVLVNGKERDASAQKYEGYTWFSPWPGEDDHTVIEVIGTSAIPEFPFAILILTFSIVSIIILQRKNVKI